MRQAAIEKRETLYPALESHVWPSRVEAYTAVAKVERRHTVAAGTVRAGAHALPAVRAIARLIVANARYMGPSERASRRVSLLAATAAHAICADTNSKAAALYTAGGMFD